MTESKDQPATTAGQQDGKFKPGQSGNPNGRPKGARHKISLLAEKLMSDDVEGVVQTVVNAAKSGDMTAARLILERVSPPRKDAPILIDLPQVKSLDDVAGALAVVIDAVSTGCISPSEGANISGLIREFSSAVEIQAIEKRLANLEALQEKK